MCRVPELESGPQGTLAAKYVSALVGNDVDLSGATTTVSRYNELGQLLEQDTVNEADHGKDYQVKYGGGYDAAGNLTDYTTVAGSSITSYHIDIEELNGYKAKSTTVSSGSGSVTTTDQYDANGNLVGLSNSGSNTDRRDLFNDAHGQVLQKSLLRASVPTRSRSTRSAISFKWTECGPPFSCQPGLVLSCSWNMASGSREES